MFNSFNKQGHTMLSAEISRELVALGARHGLTISVGGGSIGIDNLTIKLVATTNDLQAVETAARAKLQRDGHYFGLKGSDYGAIFTVQGKRYKLTGVNPGRPKFPISGESLADGRTWKHTVDCARRIIADRAVATATPVHAPTPHWVAPTALANHIVDADLEAMSAF